MAALDAVPASVESMAVAPGQAARIGALASAPAVASSTAPAERSGLVASGSAISRRAHPANREVPAAWGPWGSGLQAQPAVRGSVVLAPGATAAPFANTARDVRNALLGVGGLAGGAPPQAAAVFQMWGYRPLTDDFEEWETLGAPGTANPSGQPIVDVTYIRLTCDGE